MSDDRGQDDEDLGGDEQPGPRRESDPATQADAGLAGSGTERARDERVGADEEDTSSGES
ncbi:MAG TPA: hypothetical protein VHF25_11140 [Nitriliruptorales bacterium]|nr:hypothetical protein [Nitriliruptorales bacterium]